MTVALQTSLSPAVLDEKGAAAFARARLNMVESQLRPNGITDIRLLRAMGDLPRELFVPPSLSTIAYADADIAVASGRALMPPMVLAKLIQAAHVGAEDRVLDIAPGTGYSTLVLAALAGAVVGVEPDAVLHKEAAAHMLFHASGKAEIVVGAPADGCRAQAPFDVILINGSVEAIPEALFGQLAEGGRLVAVVRVGAAEKTAHVAHGRVYTKKNGHVAGLDLFEADVAAAPGFVAPRPFIF